MSGLQAFAVGMAAALLGIAGIAMRFGIPWALMAACIVGVAAAVLLYDPAAKGADARRKVGRRA